MPAIPLPFVIALLLAVLLMRVVLTRETGLRPAIGFVTACMIVAVAVGLRWTVDLPVVRFLQPVLAAMLPPIAWLCFTRSRSPLRAARWRHFLPVAVVFALSAGWRVWQSPLDLVLAGLYIGYGIPLLRLARSGPDGFAATRLSDAPAARMATLAAGAMLILSAIVDLSIAVDFGLFSGGHVAAIVTIGNVLLLPVLAYAVAVIGSSVPGEDAPEAAAVEPARAANEDDGRVVAAVDRVVRERMLFRDPDLTLIRLARRAGIPARQISSAVNRQQGCNVSQFINVYRLEEARRLLAETDMPVTSVMFEAGFQTKSNFNREFLKATGLTPSDYRRSVTAGPSREN